MPVLHIITNTQVSMIEWILDPLRGEPEVNIIGNPLLNKKTGIFKRILRPLAARFKFPGKFYLGRDLMTELKNIKPEDSLLFLYMENPRDVRIILHNIPSCKKKSVFFWNAIKSHDEGDDQDRRLLRKVNSFRKLCDVYTFDPGDASRFHLNLVPQIFREIERDAEIPYQEKPLDLYFVGEDKGRIQRLIDIKNAAENKGLRCKFHIFPQNYAATAYTEEQKKHLTFSRISYQENIELAEQSRCLLEIAVKNQSGPTLRTMEAAFLGCKLITDRARANESGLFPENNILTLGEKIDGDLIFDFINSPPEKMDARELDKHNIRYWWRQFL